MKRLHIHVAVGDISQSVSFYSIMFGAQPTVLKDDYAKWMLDDPCVNFAISSRGVAAGLDHLGIQVEEVGELSQIAGRLKDAGVGAFDEVGATCCYAQSDKTWVADPSGIRWETFRTFGDATVYGEDHSAEMTPRSDAGACCAPKVAPVSSAACRGAASDAA
ncbi:MAG: ArsI/CadI family heavy metal resistance metalloenzyme [Caulobacteraceae bacterium]|nr:ArsI/CadI family heavy metal resistance metalloenzyme [Caulobacteraceae bacterium]